MRIIKAVICLILLALAVSATAQTAMPNTTQGGTNQNTTYLGGLGSRKLMRIPIADTTPVWSNVTDSGRITIQPSTGILYWHNGQNWRTISAGTTYLAGYGLTLSGNTFLVDSSLIATKTYVDSVAGSGLSYISYDFTKKTNFYTVAKDGIGIKQLRRNSSSWLYLVNGWNEFASPTTDSFIHFSSDLTTWDTCHAPWRKCHAMGIGIIYGSVDTLVKFGADLNDYATYDMSAWLAYPLASGKLGFIKTQDSIAIPPRILFGSATTDNGYTYLVGGQASTSNGATLYGDIYRSNDGWRTKELVLTDSRLGGNKYGCVVARGNDLYIISGGVYYPSRTYTTSVYKLEDGTDTLYALDTLPLLYGVQYPTAFLDTNTNDIIFAFGSNVNNGGNQNFILALDTTEQWFRIFSDTISARHAAAGALFNGNWVIAGGQMTTPDVWQSNFTEMIDSSADNIHLGRMKYGDNSDIVVTLQQNNSGSAHIAIGKGSNLYARLAGNNTYTGTNQFSDIGTNEIAVYPATVITGAAKFSNNTFEPILNAFNPTGIAWKTTANDWGMVLRAAPSTGTAYALRVQNDNTASTDYIAAFSSNSGIHHSWRGNGAYYNPTRFTYSSGGKVYTVFNSTSSRMETVSAIPQADVTNLTTDLAAKVNYADTFARLIATKKYVDSMYTVLNAMYTTLTTAIAGKLDTINSAGLYVQRNCTLSTASGHAFTIGNTSTVINNSSGALNNLDIRGSVLQSGTASNRGIIISRTINSTSTGSTNGIVLSDAITSGGSGYTALSLLSNVGTGISQTGTAVTNNIAGATTLSNVSITLSGLPTYADNAAATGAGLGVGRVYKTATGELRIVY